MDEPDIAPNLYYERRDDRTLRVAANADYQAKRTALVVSEEVARSRRGQEALLTAANLLARWSRTVDLDVPKVELNPACRQIGDAGLRGALVASMKRADPFGDFGFRPAAREALVLQVGPPPHSTSVRPSFVSWAEGWDALGWAPGRTAVPDVSVNTPLFGPSLQLAVCLGVAQLFKEANEQSPDHYLKAFRWSLWTHRRRDVDAPPTEATPDVLEEQGQDVGQVLQVGVGAVGSNVLYFLRHLGVVANVMLVDHDVVKVENLDRTLLFGWPEALPDEQLKALAAEELLTGSRVAAEGFDGQWSDFLAAPGQGCGGYDVWLPLANEYGVRHRMALSFPPLMVHGSTSSDWGVYCARHIPTRDYCLSCRFPPGGETPDFDCGRGKALPETGDNSRPENVDSSLPFLSAAAAALTVGELLKASLPGYEEGPSFVSANLQGAMEIVVAVQHPRRRGCTVCRNIPREEWRDRIVEGRYATLVEGK